MPASVLPREVVAPETDLVIRSVAPDFHTLAEDSFVEPFGYRLLVRTIRWREIADSFVRKVNDSPS